MAAYISRICENQCRVPCSDKRASGRERRILHASEVTSANIGIAFQMPNVKMKSRLQSTGGFFCSRGNRAFVVVSMVSALGASSQSESFRSCLNAWNAGFYLSGTGILANMRQWTSDDVRPATCHPMWIHIPCVPGSVLISRLLKWTSNPDNLFHRVPQRLCDASMKIMNAPHRSPLILFGVQRSISKWIS